MQIDQMNIRILLTTRRFLLFSIAAGLVAAGLVFGLMIPQVNETVSVVNKLNKEKPKTEALTRKLKSLENLTSTAEFAQIEIVEKALPSKKPLLELLMSLSTVSQQTGVLITKFELSPGLVATDSAEIQDAGPNANKGYDSLSVDLEVQGSFQQLQDFLLQVEQVAPFTTVSEMEISGQVSDASQLESDQPFKAALTTETFFFTKPLAVKVETPLPTIGTPQQNVLAALASFAPTNLPEQTEVTGGGLEDLFGVEKIESEEQLESLLQQRSVFPLGTPTPGTGTGTGQGTGTGFGTGTGTTGGTGTVQGVSTGRTPTPTPAVTTP